MSFIKAFLSSVATGSMYYLISLSVLVIFLPNKAKRGVLLCLYWLLWILFSFLSISFQWIVVLWTSIRVIITLLFYANIRLLSTVSDSLYHGFRKIWRCRSHSGITDLQQVELLERVLHTSEDYEKWRKTAQVLDGLDNIDSWKSSSGDGEDDLESELMKQQIDKIRMLSEKKDLQELMFYLRGVLSRSNCHMNNPSLYQKARVGTKFLIHEFLEEVSRSLSEISMNAKDVSDASLLERIQFFKSAQQSFGKSALCLSGGGSLSMYHIGVVKALKQENLLPRIISGTSGGSIVAGVLAVHTDEELDEMILVPEVSTFRGVRWFEPLNRQIFQFLTNGVLMENEFFDNAVFAYFGDYTFEEAFRRTHRVVNIVLTHASSDSKSKMILMNHVTSPHVLIRSAVHASCALPGLMKPVDILAKDRNGNISSYLPGKFSRFVDGSLKADIPIRRLSELFNVTQCIVSQVNPHIAPFMRIKTQSVHKLGLLSRLEYMAMLDLKSSLRKLAKLRLLPKIFGQDVSAVLTQKYSGDINIYPKLSFVDNFNVISHPSLEDMKRYIRGGMKSVWPVMSQIECLCAIENVLETCSSKLERVLSERKSVEMSPVSPVRPLIESKVDSILCKSCIAKLIDQERNDI